MESQESQKNQEEQKQSLEQIAISVDENYNPFISHRTYSDSKIIEEHKNKAGAVVTYVPASSLPHGIGYKVLGKCEYGTESNKVSLTHPEELPLEYQSTNSHEEAHSIGIHSESGAEMYRRAEGYFNKRDFADKKDFFMFLAV